MTNVLEFTSPVNTIRDLNDRFRRTFTGGKVLLTPGIVELPDATRGMVVNKVRTFDSFTEDNDPHGEHDFGSFDVDGEKVFWKVDYYDSKLEYGSENPADPNQTTRVLTIMLASEY